MGNKRTNQIIDESKTTMKKKMPKTKTAKVMHEWKTGTLHSGKGGPIVTNRKQAIAIALSEQAQAKKKKKKK